MLHRSRTMRLSAHFLPSFSLPPLAIVNYLGYSDVLKCGIYSFRSVSQWSYARRLFTSVHLACSVEAYAREMTQGIHNHGRQPVKPSRMHLHPSRTIFCNSHHRLKRQLFRVYPIPSFTEPNTPDTLLAAFLRASPLHRGIVLGTGSLFKIDRKRR